MVRDGGSEDLAAGLTSLRQGFGGLPELQRRRKTRLYIAP
jgi:hypothetical protein